MTLRRRLFLAIGLLAALSVALAFTIGTVLARRAVEKNTLRDVSGRADLLARRERKALLACSDLPTDLIRRQGERSICTPLTAAPPLFVPPDVLQKLKNDRAVDDTRELNGVRVFYAARRVQDKALVLMRPTSLAASAWRPHVEGLLVGALSAVVLATLAAFLLARAISRPIGRVAAATRSLAAERTFEPVPEEGARELASLARSFNEMAAQLAQARAAERQFLLSVSHELKTPLTAIRGYAEGLEDHAVPAEEATGWITREAARLERLVQDLLDLGRMRRAEFSIRREPIDLGVVARESAARYEGQARDFGVSLEIEVADPSGAVGDADRMVQVVSNLVENALRVAPVGGSVRIVAAPGQLAVADDGPGLGEDELPRAFERFYLHSRYGRERSVGTGLGLAIVKELVEGMGGTVGVESAPGRTVFTVRLPPAPPDDAGDDVLRAAYEPRIPA